MDQRTAKNELWKKRNERKNMYMSQGLTERHAWWKTFQDFPDPIEDAPNTQEGDAAVSRDVLL